MNAALLENLIPRPRHIDVRSGTTKPPSVLALHYKGLPPDDADSVAQLAEIVLKPWLNGPTKSALSVTLQRSSAPLSRQLKRTPQPLVREAYLLNTSGKGIRITAPYTAGLRLALQTLKQILENAHEYGVLPHCHIVDWPRIANRGIHYDIAREMEYRPAHFKKVVERLAYFKINQLHFYFENKFLFRSSPETAAQGACTPRQARALCDYARLFGITVVPQMVTLGHMNNFLHGPYQRFREDPKTSWNLCPTHPQVRSWLAGMIADVADAFQSPYIHVGYDESHSGVCKRCQRQGTPQQLLAQHLNWLNAEIKKHGARTMIYGDMFVSLAEFPLQDAANGGTPQQALTALRTVDRDIIITNWHYTAPYSETTRYFVKNGFTVYGVTASNIYWHDSIPLNRGQFWISETTDRDIQEGASGMFNSNWEFYRGQCFDNYWYHNALSAEHYWTDTAHNPAAWGTRFTSRFYGLAQDYYSSIAGLMETTKCVRRPAFLVTHVLDLPNNSSISPLAGWSWRLPTLDHPEIGTHLIERAGEFRRLAKRNSDSLRFFDMPGQIIHYIGTRARAIAFLQIALEQGNRADALSALDTIRNAALQVAPRLDALYKVYGCAVTDRDRLLVHLTTLNTLKTLIRKKGKRALKNLTVAKLIAVTKQP